MSLFGAMNTAISGLTAQSNAFGNISDNVANSQTVGYKRVDTTFVDYLTTSNATVNNSGAVVARPQYVNNVQGTITQTDNPLGLAIAGQGFFAVSQLTGQINNIPTFNPQQYYTRAGDFQLDKNGYLVNTAGQFLNGWPVNSQTGVVNQNTLNPIQVTQTVYNPVATANVTISANLPATPATGTAIPGAPISSAIDVYDALGTVHTVNLNWVKNASDDWTVSVDVPNDVAAPARGSAQVQFGPTTSGNPVPSGTIGAITPSAPPPVITATPYASNTAAQLSFSTDFGSGPQNITLNLGTYGQTNGITQYAGTQYNLRGLTQDGVPPGSFASVTTQANGNIVVNYDNGQARVIAQVPVVTFNAPDELQRQDGQSFTATLESGTPLAEAPSTNGAGNLVTESVESSNVDIATEFSKLIVAQRAYTASTKMVTTADDLLQQTIDMKR
ncbi:MAG: flagellar hook protein FlgE [Acetobacteraceae bacterium]